MPVNKKLYPPNIEGTIPAFYGTTLVVPFSMNKAVSKIEVEGIAIKIKTIQSGSYIINGQTVSLNQKDLESGKISFDFSKEVSEKKFNIGQYYKIQIAYIQKDTGTIGYYSTVGVVKYTSEPTVEIVDLSRSKTNEHQYQYIGKYAQSKDFSEKVYSYCFNVYDNNLNLIQTTGEQIHNSLLDTDLYESYDSFILQQDLDDNKIYYIEYNITTLNGLQKSSGQYRLTQKKTLSVDFGISIIPTLNFENGYILLQLENQKDVQDMTGTFKLLRSNELSDFKTWDEILRFTLSGKSFLNWSWKDFTIQQGIRYKYALQQYNGESLLDSNKLISESIYADFEHSFLYDGERQLKIKYNPKVASFKNIVLETKTNTIGSQYPFIFRNGNVDYKEFPISGLISCQSDEENLFFKTKDFDGTIDLINTNIYEEREFKLEVLDWLNDGKPKLFKSPVEGNYLVRLLNVSLTPIDTVGRMLHSFTATASQIAEQTHEALIEQNIISLDLIKVKELKWMSVELNKASSQNLLEYAPAVSLTFEGMIPGDKVYIDDGIVHDSTSGKTGFSVTIGITGNYNIDLKSNVKINSVKFEYSSDSEENGLGIVQHQGILTYAYYGEIKNKFDIISRVEVEDIPVQQYLGWYESDSETKQFNVLNKIENIKTKIQSIYFAKFTLRPILTAYLIDGVYYEDQNGEREVVINYQALYYITDFSTSQKYYYDFYNEKSYSEYNAYVYFNNNSPINLYLTKYFEITNVNDISTLTIGNGVMLELSYQKQIMHYVIEMEDETLIELKEKADKDYNDFYNIIYVDYPDDVEITDLHLYTPSEEDIKRAKINYETSYQNYIDYLTQTLAEEEAE